MNLFDLLLAILYASREKPGTRKPIEKWGIKDDSRSGSFVIRVTSQSVFFAIETAAWIARRDRLNDSLSYPCKFGAKFTSSLGGRERSFFIALPEKNWE